MKTVPIEEPPLICDQIKVGGHTSSRSPAPEHHRQPHSGRRANLSPAGGRPLLTPRRKKESGRHLSGQTILLRAQPCNRAWPLAVGMLRCPGDCLWVRDGSLAFRQARLPPARTSPAPPP